MAGSLTERGYAIPSRNRYVAIIKAIFHAKYQPGQRVVAFEREDIVTFASRLNIQLPKNLGDLVYSFRYRTALPSSILAEAPAGETWIIRPAGRSRYQFVLVADRPLVPNPNLAVTKVPDSTPGIIEKYAFNDEQASGDVRVVSEKHYQLVPPDGVTTEDLTAYRQRLSD